MLKRLHVDNFRSLVEFDFEPGQLCLLVGGNGSGKTTVFEVLDLVRRLLVDGVRISEVFPASSLTRWRKDPVQRVQLTVEDQGIAYDYSLDVEHTLDEGKLRIVQETLSYGGKPLFRAGIDRALLTTFVARLYRDDHSEGPPLIMDWSRSGVGLIEPKSENRKLVRFREIVSRILLARIAPGLMQGRADGESTHPIPDFSNFAAWYRHESQEQAEQMRGLFDDLRKVIPGFAKLRLVQFPDNVRDLRVELETQSERKEYRLSELSDGQRVLIGLYSLLHCSVAQGGILLLDEPDNFVALAELQPWLVAFADKVRSSGGQAIIASHHPEIIDYLACEGALLFVRESGGATAIRRWSFDTSSGVKASEALARGWEDA